MLPIRRRILLIEDDADSAEALTLLLDLLGFDATWVRDGAEALQTLDSVRRLGHSYPDLMLLDLNRPGDDGSATGRELAEYRRLCPIVLVSALSEPQIQRAAAEIGAAAWLRKPFGAGDLLRVLESLADRQPAMA